MESLGTSPEAPSSKGLVFHWYVISIDTGHIAQSLQFGPRWSPAFKMEPVLSVSSFNPISLSPSVILSLSLCLSLTLSHIDNIVILGLAIYTGWGK